MCAKLRKNARRPDSTDESWVPPGKTAEPGEEKSGDDENGAGNRGASGPVAGGSVTLVALLPFPAGSDSQAILSVRPLDPDSVAVARLSARALAGIGSAAPTGSVKRPPGSNRPVNMDRKTGP